MIPTAKTGLVPVGSITVEGLMTEDDQCYIPVAQMVSLNLISENRSKDQLKALLGKEFQPHRLSTDRRPQVVDCVTTEQFLRVVCQLIKDDNQYALDFLENLEVFADEYSVDIYE